MAALIALTTLGVDHAAARLHGPVASDDLLLRRFHAVERPLHGRHPIAPDGAGYAACNKFFYLLS